MAAVELPFEVAMDVVMLRSVAPDSAEFVRQEKAANSRSVHAKRMSLQVSEASIHQRSNQQAHHLSHVLLPGVVVDQEVTEFVGISIPEFRSVRSIFQGRSSTPLRSLFSAGSLEGAFINSRVPGYAAPTGV
jgi:hypothetical protein